MTERKSIAGRLFSLLMALVMILALLAFPAGTAYADQEYSYTLEEIVEEEVPLALRKEGHTDSFFPFLCVLLALGFQIFYVVRSRRLRREIFELQAGILCRNMSR